MLVTNLPRQKLISVLPPGGVVAEIGVYRCKFAVQILHYARPSVLHLIDPWEKDGEYVQTYGAKDDMPGLYENARRTFADQIAQGTVVLHRDFSHNVAPRFTDGSLDWAYIDGMHTYEAVKTDLEAFAPKIAEDGYLLGHDFSNSPQSRRRNFGVIRAVKEFVATNPFDLVMFTYEAAPTYVLARSNRPQAGQDLCAKVIERVDAHNFEIDASVFEGFDQILTTLPDGRKRPLFRFRPKPT